MRSSTPRARTTQRASERARPDPLWPFLLKEFLFKESALGLGLVAAPTSGSSRIRCLLKSRTPAGVKLRCLARSLRSATPWHRSLACFARFALLWRRSVSTRRWESLRRPDRLHGFAELGAKFGFDSYVGRYIGIDSYGEILRRPSSIMRVRGLWEQVRFLPGRVGFHPLRDFRGEGARTTQR